MTLRVVFMGTPEFAVPSLSEILANGHEVARVYTQPPRPAGRGQKLTKSPVHQFAEIMGLPVETPESFRKSKIIDSLAELDADVACVVAYGQILPQRALDAPRYGCLNLHASLLPRWRGAAPVQRAIMAGDTQTACQIMQMAKGLDTGDILLSELVDIGSDDTAASLFGRLSQIGAGMWPRTLAALERGGLVPTPQTGEAIYAEKITKAEARIDWSRPATDLDCHIRGLSPFPGAWTQLDGKRVKILMTRRTNLKLKNMNQEPGSLGGTENLLALCGSGETLEIVTLQPEGKKAMSGTDFKRGLQNSETVRFE